jgi:TolB-like protein
MVTRQNVVDPLADSTHLMSEIFRFADLELDTALFQVRRNQQVLAVQPQVFDVLLYLLKHRDRVVSKDELLEQVWQGRVISETALSSRIKAVRQLIGDSGDQQSLIRTIRNRGFQFVGEVSVRLTDAQQIISQGTPARDTGITGIAVLPFETYDAGPGREYFGQGIAADIIAMLARHHWLRVISRGSSFAFSDARYSPQDIGDALDVRYVLMGRIRHLGQRIRIDAELAECNAGAHLWSQKYEGDETDLFTLQEEIAQQIAAEIGPELGQIEGERTRSVSKSDLDAWGCCHKGFLHLYRFSIDDLNAARKWFGRALEIDEGLAYAHAGLAYVAVQLAFYGAPSRRDEELASALESSQLAVGIDRWDAFNHFVLGRTLSLLQRFDEARSELEMSIDLNPSFALAYFALGFSFTNSGKPAEAIPLFEKAVDLSPRDPHIWTFHHLRSWAHFRLDQMREAELHVRKAVRMPNATYWPFATLCAILADVGKTSEAAAIADRLVQMKPGYDLEYAKQDFFFAPQDAFVERYLSALASAGMR